MNELQIMKRTKKQIKNTVIGVLILFFNCLFWLLVLAGIFGIRETFGVIGISFAISFTTNMAIDFIEKGELDEKENNSNNFDFSKFNYNLKHDKSL